MTTCKDTHWKIVDILEKWWILKFEIWNWHVGDKHIPINSLLEDIKMTCKWEQDLVLTSFRVYTYMKIKILPSEESTVRKKDINGWGPINRAFWEDITLTQ